MAVLAGLCLNWMEVFTFYHTIILTESFCHKVMSCEEVDGIANSTSADADQTTLEVCLKP